MKLNISQKMLLISLTAFIVIMAFTFATLNFVINRYIERIEANSGGGCFWRSWNGIGP